MLGRVGSCGVAWGRVGSHEAGLRAVLASLPGLIAFDWAGSSLCPHRYASCFQNILSGFNEAH